MGLKLYSERESNCFKKNKTSEAGGNCFIPQKPTNSKPQWFQYARNCQFSQHVMETFLYFNLQTQSCFTVKSMPIVPQMYYNFIKENVMFKDQNLKFALDIIPSEWTE